MVVFFFISGSLKYDFFFFSSRRRHTRSKRDWSSDVCSSDLVEPQIGHRQVVVTLSIGDQRANPLEAIDSQRGRPSWRDATERHHAPALLDRQRVSHALELGGWDRSILLYCLYGGSIFTCSRSFRGNTR